MTVFGTRAGVRASAVAVWRIVAETAVWYGVAMGMATALVVWLVPALAAVNPDVQAAVKAYDGLDFQAVAPLLEKALASPDLSTEDRVTALAYLGRTHAVFRRAKRAREVFVSLLQLAPDFVVGSGESPLIRDAFADAQREIRRLAVARERKGPAQPSELAPRVAAPTAAATPATSRLFPDDSEASKQDDAVFYWGLGAAGVAVVLTIALVIARPWREDGEKVTPDFRYVTP